MFESDLPLNVMFIVLVRASNSSDYSTPSYVVNGPLNKG